MRRTNGEDATGAGNGNGERTQPDAGAGKPRRDEPLRIKRRKEGWPTGKTGARPDEALVGESPAFLGALEHLKAVVDHALPILLLGETGTGKELVAKAIHGMSKRREQPFVSFNCATGTVELFDNLLFGHKRGTYTGADQDTRGLLGQAEAGTLFLDEVDSLPRAAQAKLLRFLDRFEVQQLGGEVTRTADVLIIAACNSDLQRAVAREEFRSDLYYRLSGWEVRLPPLRQRGADILLLARYFLDRYGASFAKPGLGLTPPACAKLMAHSWPGNVRDLSMVIRRALVVAEGRLVGPEDVRLPGSAGRPKLGTLRDAVAEAKGGYLAKLKEEHANNLSAAARVAHVQRKSLQRLYKQYGLGSASTATYT